MKRDMRIFCIVFMFLILLAGVFSSYAEEKPVGMKADFQPEGCFYVYTDKGSRFNHKVPSGWMGDYGDITLDANWRDNPQSGTTCMKWTYTAKGSQDQGYAGVNWQTPMGWYRPGREKRYDLGEAQRLTFWARGENGNERIKVQIGGIYETEKFSDSDTKTSDVLTLSKDWQKFTLDLSGTDLSNISGIFCCITDKEMNPQGCVFYLDNIRYEK